MYLRIPSQRACMLPHWGNKALQLCSEICTKSELEASTSPSISLLLLKGKGLVFVFQLVSHIEEMLQTAYNKLHTWQSRRLMKKTWSVLSSHRFCEAENCGLQQLWKPGLTDMQGITRKWRETSAARRLLELMLLYLHIENWKERNCD